ncbi:6-phospho-beta-glucosidase [Sporomusaceae bacterium BoRhaA]|uniref:6-phospho-beta-glucosidase n=1 Tax=Pelorhabdus rhamnosifermentans TaxID=2772457 RepID=UPI001C0626CF|nr:6-phospho-beta-glucosidase [Pelorhabdus rhamnosifermentans]MBU2700136.1 6-phospho-beta-glucosidase [Pelorhabdus rhamnosifermentans]
MKKLKIVTIGGGSSYTPELMEGFIKRYKEFPVSEIWLVDIEEGREKLEIVGAMAKRMWRASGYPCEVHLTLNRREALKNADFVTTQFRVGLLDARIKDERIPLKYGILGQETNGAGGMLKAFRTVPIILDIIKDMKELCPEAWLINFTNPSGMITEAAIKYGGFEKTIGLCNVPLRYMMMASEALDIPVAELDFKFAGLNHFHWHRVWDKTGKERTDEVIEVVYNPNSTKEFKGMENIKDIKMLYEQIKDLGLLPCSYHRYYYIMDEMLKDELEEFKKGETRAEIVKKLEAQLFELYKDPKLNYKPEQLSKRGGAYYSDVACEIINSIYNDKGTTMVVSTRNNGTISDLPHECIVEVSSLITSRGPQPLNWGHFDSAPRALVQHMKGMEETVTKAAVTGDYNKALHAFIINPLVPSGKIAKTLLDEMLVAHKKYLPQFREKITQLEAQLSH